jgi:hypothetical protein
MLEDGFGLIYLQTSQGCFPADNWDDFGGGIAFEWLNSTLRWRAQHEEGACRLWFFDGPYEFHVARTNADELTLQFYRGGAERGSLIAIPKFKPEIVSRREFFESLLRLVSVITWQRDADKVAQMTDELRRSLGEG